MGSMRWRRMGGGSPVLGMGMEMRMGMGIAMVLAMGVVIAMGGSVAGGQGGGAGGQGSGAGAAPMEEIARLVAEGNDSAALLKINGALGMKGAAAAAFDRCGMLLIKGEIHLRNKAVRLATEAYEAAAREAKEPAQKRAVGAYLALLGASKGLVYTPRTAGGAGGAAAAAAGAAGGAVAAAGGTAAGVGGVTRGLDIADPVSRRGAFAALFEDQWLAASAQVDRALAAKALPPVVEVAGGLDRLAGVEMAASGDAVRTRALVAKMTDGAKKMIAEGLRPIAKGVSATDKAANAFQVEYMEVYDPNYLTPRLIRKKVFRRTGLSEAQITAMHEVTVTCDQIGSAIDALSEALSGAGGGGGGAGGGGAGGGAGFGPLSEEVGRIRKEADRLLETDYLKVYDQLPK